jgi:hypothetical protein
MTEDLQVLKTLQHRTLYNNTEHTDAVDSAVVPRLDEAQDYVTSSMARRMA